MIYLLSGLLIVHGIVCLLGAFFPFYPPVFFFYWFFPGHFAIRLIIVLLIGAAQLAYRHHHRDQWTVGGTVLAASLYRLRHGFNRGPDRLACGRQEALAVLSRPLLRHEAIRVQCDTVFHRLLKPSKSPARRPPYLPLENMVRPIPVVTRPFDALHS